MLIIQIAFGIALGYLILAYFPQILTLLGCILAGGIVIFFVFFAVVYIEDLVPLFIIGLFCLMMYLGGAGIHMLAKLGNPERKNTDQLGSCFIIGSLNFILFFILAMFLPPINGLDGLGFDSETLEFAPLAVAVLLSFWSWPFVFLNYNLLGKSVFDEIFSDHYIEANEK